jgi:hypothetical protein
MHIPKRYFHDRMVLLLLSVNIFLALLCSILILFKLDNNSESLKLVRYRPDLGLSSYTYSTSNMTYISFIVFALFVLAFHWVLSVRVYGIRRHFSVAVLALGMLLLVLTIIISNALLVLK